MSWYSDGTAFDEYEPIECQYCNKEVNYEVCKACQSEEENDKGRGEKPAI